MERWKQVKGYDKYFISDQGRIKSVDKKVNSGLKNQKQTTVKGRMLKPQLTRGYPRIGLWLEGKCKHFLVHMLVSEAFIDKMEGKGCVNHKNGIKTDNRYTNLEWCTYSENNQHAYDNNLKVGRCRKPLLCIETNTRFESTYKAAEWLNETKFNYTKRIDTTADKIRLACKGKQKTAYGHHWKYIND